MPTKLPSPQSGSFTLPGEAGYEKLTLRLAKTWGADTIRDSDGTQLSDEIAESGYNIYSTLCLVRSDNAWAKANPTKLQQSWLMSFPVMAGGTTVTVDLLKGYFREQFRVNADDSAHEWWQVFDRTAGVEIPTSQWDFDAAKGTVTIRGTTEWHSYTVNFFAYRIWEEISMYNHVTNNWGDREHLMPIDPIHPEAREQMLAYLDRWIAAHPHTKVVRFTSMFYNFFWPWGDEPKRRFVINDWGSYEFSVTPAALLAFEKARGYRPKSEDFVNGGLYCTSHTVPSKTYQDWIDFIIGFVTDFSRVCVERVHAAGKQAYVFYNDHWIGLEPTDPRFVNIGFDGIIDGIFSGFEARKVSATPGVNVREIRLHPYFFPTGVNGAPSFLPGGNPTLECQTYWIDIRRALLRASFDRIGFGGYLHLVENHPKFIRYVTGLAAEFRELKSLHVKDRPYTAPVKVAILSAWGTLRAWACCGHFNHGNPYNEIMESLSGLPVETTFLSFEDILRDGIPADLDVIINAGRRDDAWGGGRYWTDPRIVEKLTAWVAQGGGFIGVGEPSSVAHGGKFFQLSHLLGVDRELGLSTARAKYAYDAPKTGHFVTADLPESPNFGKEVDGIHALDGETAVLLDANKSVRVAVRAFGKGRSVYLSGHDYSPSNIRLLHRAILWAGRDEKLLDRWHSHNANTECAYYPRHKKLVVANLTAKTQVTAVTLGDGKKTKRVTVPGYGCKILAV